MAEKQDFWRDNRDIRDNYYEGELIVPANEKHIHATTKEGALEKIKSILQNDLFLLKDYLKNVIEYEAKSKEELQKELEEYNKNRPFSKVKSLGTPHHRKYSSLDSLKEVIKNCKKRIYELDIQKERD
jgi:hypothetical protein